MENQQTIANRLRDTILELESKRGELAETLKAEARGKSDAFMNSQGVTSDTGRRNYAEAQVIDYTCDIHDLKAEIQSYQEWVAFYTLLLKHDIVIELEGCPPKSQRE